MAFSANTKDRPVVIAGIILLIVFTIAGLRAIAAPGFWDAAMPIVGVGLVVLGIIALLCVFSGSVATGYTSGNDATHICPNCRSLVRPVKVTPGSTLLELFLWICFLLPGILYTAYCSANKKTVCPVCGAQNPVPLSTPAGQALAAATR